MEQTQYQNHSNTGFQCQSGSLSAELIWETIRRAFLIGYFFVDPTEAVKRLDSVTYRSYTKRAMWVCVTYDLFPFPLWSTS